MYLTLLNLASWVFGGLMLLSVILLLPKIFYHIYGLRAGQRFPAAKTLHKFAILVPARNESQVIEDLLQSFAACDYPQSHFDVYVIVEDAADPTCEICRRYPFATCFVRPNLDVKCKGAALDQMVHHLIASGTAAKKDYAAYFIFDADNVVAPNYLSAMNQVVDAGYDMGLGYRNTRNWNDGWVAACSAVTFSMINTFQNQARARFTQNVLVSGTGYYVRAELLHQLGGWPFQSLTEDVEISYYAALHNWKSTYNPAAEFFDEQPTTLALSCRQRLRWVKGYGQVVKRSVPPMVKKFFTTKQQRWGKLDFALNIIPVAVPLASVIIYLLYTAILGCVGLGLCQPRTDWLTAWGASLTTLLATYLFFFGYCVLMLLVEHRRINLTFPNAVKTCVMFPFFMALYIPIFLVACCKKEVAWTKIQRRKERTDHAR